MGTKNTYSSADAVVTIEGAGATTRRVSLYGLVPSRAQPSRKCFRQIMPSSASNEWEIEVFCPVHDADYVSVQIKRCWEYV